MQVPYHGLKDLYSLVLAYFFVLIATQGPLFTELQPYWPLDVQPDMAAFPLASHTCGCIIREALLPRLEACSIYSLKAQLEYYLSREVSLDTVCEVASLVTFQQFLPP